MIGTASLNCIIFHGKDGKHKTDCGSTFYSLIEHSEEGGISGCQGQTRGSVVTNIVISREE